MPANGGGASDSGGGGGLLPFGHGPRNVLLAGAMLLGKLAHAVGVDMVGGAGQRIVDHAKVGLKPSDLGLELPSPTPVPPSPTRANTDPAGGTPAAETLNEKGRTWLSPCSPEPVGVGVPAAVGVPDRPTSLMSRLPPPGQLIGDPSWPKTWIGQCERQDALLG